MATKKQQRAVIDTKVVPVKPVYDNLLLLVIPDNDERVGNIIVPASLKKDKVPKAYIVDKGEDCKIKAEIGDVVIFDPMRAKLLTFKLDNYAVLQERGIYAVYKLGYLNDTAVNVKEKGVIDAEENKGNNSKIIK